MSEDDRLALQRRNFATLGVMAVVIGSAFGIWQGSIGAGVWMFGVFWAGTFLATEAVNK